MDPDQSSPTATVLETVNAAATRFIDAGFPTPRLDAEVLLREVLGLDRTTYFLQRTDPISAADLEAYERLVRRRLERESVAYIVGRREFMGLSFAVGTGVLVPRPETELLVEWAIGQIGGRRGETTVLDIGTGSGAVALSIAAQTQSARLGTVLASDISDAALRYAARNRDALGLGGRVSLVRGDLGRWCGRPVDLLVANLPYLRPDQILENPDLTAEPVRALDGGRDGLDLVRGVLADAPRLLSSDGAIGLEVDPSQAEATVALGRASLPARRWSVISDLAGYPRHVVGA